MNQAPVRGVQVGHFTKFGLEPIDLGAQVSNLMVTVEHSLPEIGCRHHGKLGAVLDPEAHVAFSGVVRHGRHLSKSRSMAAYAFARGSLPSFS